MYDTGNGRYSDGAPHQSEIEHVTASEVAAGYEATPSLADALADVEAALARLADVDMDAESNRELLTAAVGAQDLVNRLVAQQLRIIEAVDRRDAYTDDAAVTTASWLRTRTRLTHGEVTAQANAAQRLRRLNRLRDVFESGDVTYSHVKVVTSAAIPLRMDAITAVEPDLVDLALHTSPKELRVAVARVRDLADPDGAEAEPLCDHGPDERRDLVVLDGIDGLGELRATLDPLDLEALRTLLDAFETPDPADTPSEQRRSAGQRRADAFSAMLKALLASDTTKTVEGYRAQILCVVDILSLLGLDTLTDLTEVTDAQLAVIAGVADVDLDTARRIAAHAIDRAAPAAATDTVSEPGDGGTATTTVEQPATDAASTDDGTLDGETDGATVRAGPPVRDLPGLGQPARSPRLRYAGPTTPAVVRQLADHAKIQVLVTMGPWRAVTVGDTMRNLPPWLRTALAAIHSHCRGPDCDRPTSWTGSHHQQAWVDGGHTDVNQMAPLCRAHHTPVTEGRWTMTADCETGTTTWTTADGHSITTQPPPLAP